MTRQTSIEVYNRIEREGLLSNLRFRVYEAIFRNGPITQREVVEILKPLQDRSITPRFAELEKRDVIHSIGERPCKITGNNVLLWEITNRLPVNFKQKQRIKCEHCNGKGYHDK